MRQSHPPGGPAVPARLLREQLNEMMAAGQALGPALAGQERQGAYLAVINRGMCRMLRLIRRWEADERLGSPDELRLDRAAVDLAALCRELMDQVRPLSALLGVGAQFSTALPMLPALADRGALEDMLLELISGALRSCAAAGGGGSLQLELARQENKAVFTLTDTGGGLDARTMAGLFAPPEELDGEERDGEDPGAGELFLAQRVAALHGGILIADNQPQRGVRLVVSIPILERVGGALRSPLAVPVEEGGWSKALVALSDCLPLQAFLPGRWEG